MIWSSKKQQKAGPKQDETTRAAAPASGKKPTGLAVEPPPAAGNPLRSEQAQRRAAIAIRRSLAFAQAVLLFMYSPRHKHLSLSDLEWVVLPALAAGQLRIGHTKAKKSDVSVPAALVSWASVSAEVDKRLSANLDAPIRLQPREWQSGEILWLVDAIGSRNVIQSMLDKLAARELKGRQLKARIRGQDGKVTVQVLQPKAAQQNVAPGTRA